MMMKKTPRQYGPAWLSAELVAWIAFPIGILWFAYDRLARFTGATPEQRADRMVRWYPPEWRERYGEEFRAVLLDAMAEGRDGPRLWLDVAREAASRRAPRPSRAWLAAGLWTVGIVAVLPLGIVNAILTDVSLALAAAIVAAGLVMIAASIRTFRTA
jgi:hypothetical protein